MGHGNASYSEQFRDSSCIIWETDGSWLYIASLKTSFSNRKTTKDVLKKFCTKMRYKNSELVPYNSSTMIQNLLAEYGQKRCPSSWHYGCHYPWYYGLLCWLRSQQAIDSWSDYFSGQQKSAQLGWEHQNFKSNHLFYSTILGKAKICTIALTMEHACRRAESYG